MEHLKGHPPLFSEYIGSHSRDYGMYTLPVHTIILYLHLMLRQISYLLL